MTALLFGCAFVAGVINSIAGGGTLLTYPTLLAAGLPPIVANATSNVSLVQGSLAAFWGYRKTLAGHGRLIAWILPASLVGAAAGAYILLRLSDRSFARVVPWLILGATLLFLLSNRLHARWRSKPEVPIVGGRLAVLVVVQLIVAVYGGFFGAGQGILMLATLGLCGMRDISRMNGLKNLAAVANNGIATVLFIIGGKVQWRPALIMAAAASLGGFVGAWAGQKVAPGIARGAVVVIGILAAAYSFQKAFG